MFSGSMKYLVHQSTKSVLIVVRCDEDRFDLISSSLRLLENVAAVLGDEDSEIEEFDLDSFRDCVDIPENILDLISSMMVWAAEEILGCGSAANVYIAFQMTW